MSAKRTSSRRQFITGRAAADAAGDALAGAGQERPHDLPDGDPAGSDYLVQVGRRAMACQFQVFLNAGQYEHGMEAATAALDLVGRLESLMTVFRKNSRISRLNRRAAVEAVKVEPALFRLLSRSVEIYNETGGVFDISSGPLSEVWGFARRSGSMPKKEDLAAALETVGSRHLELDAEKETVRFLKPGVRLNLGGIGKGFALDEAAAQLQAAGIGDFLFHGGNSSVLACGSKSGSGEAGGWTVGLVHPLRPKKRLAEIRLVNRSLATSGGGTQFFHHRGRRYGHVLDPRTGQTAEGVLSCTVLAPTATDADALSTALYVLGPERAADFCQEHLEISAVLICPVGRAGGIEIRQFNIPQGDWQPIEPD